VSETRSKADELAEQIAVLFGWTGVRAETKREKALNQLWQEWAEERGGYLAEHRALTNARVNELARQYDARREANMKIVRQLVSE
jgi:hypothetical protein